MNIFKRKPKITLRDVGVDLFGEEFGQQYDTLASGGSIGDLHTTVVFIQKLECVKEIINPCRK